MKKLLLPIAFASAVIFTACGDKKQETDRDMVLLTDPAHNNSLLTDTGAAQQTVPVPQQEVAVAPPVRATAPSTRPSTPKYNQPVKSNTPAAQAPVVRPEPAPEVTPTPAPTTETAGTGSGATETETTPAAEPAKKKGISNTAKGAIIGGVGGAVAGAVIGKGGKGAIIGGVIGAAGGAIIGKKKDKKADTTGN